MMESEDNTVWDDLRKEIPEANSQESLDRARSDLDRQIQRLTRTGRRNRIVFACLIGLIAAFAAATVPMVTLPGLPWAKTVTIGSLGLAGVAALVFPLLFWSAGEPSYAEREARILRNRLEAASDAEVAGLVEVVEVPGVKTSLERVAARGFPITLAEAAWLKTRGRLLLKSRAVEASLDKIREATGLAVGSAAAPTAQATREDKRREGDDGHQK